MNLRLLLLTLCQGMLLINNVVFIAVNGLVGLALAPTAWLATLPITAYVAGGALATGLVARTQRRYGRQRSFQLGLLVAMLSAAVCAWAAVNRNFWLLTAATLVAGFYSANGSLYRFAAAELVEPEFKERAISWVLAGGIIGGVVTGGKGSGVGTGAAIGAGVGGVGGAVRGSQKWNNHYWKKYNNCIQKYY